MPAEGFDRTWDKQETDTYRIRAEHQFRYPGPYYSLTKEYFKRKSDWKLERLTFDSSVMPPQFEWIADDGIDTRKNIAGLWKTADHTAGHEAILLQLQADGRYELTIGENTAPKKGRYTLQNNTLTMGYITCKKICFDKTGDVMTFGTTDGRLEILYRQK